MGGTAAAGLRRAPPRRCASDLDLHQPSLRRPRRRLGAAGVCLSKPPRARLPRSDQLVRPGERLEHALALAERLRATPVFGLAAGVLGADATAGVESSDLTGVGRGTIVSQRFPDRR